MRLYRDRPGLPIWARTVVEATLFVILLIAFYIALSAAYAAIGVPES